MINLRAGSLGDNPNEASVTNTQTTSTAKRVAAFATSSCDQVKFSSNCSCRNENKFVCFVEVLSSQIPLFIIIICYYKIGGWPKIFLLFTASNLDSVSQDRKRMSWYQSGQRRTMSGYPLSISISVRAHIGPSVRERIQNVLAYLNFFTFL